jgi:hypothetical protein
MVRSSMVEIAVHSLNEECLIEGLGIPTVFPAMSAAAVEMLQSVLVPNLVFQRSPDPPFVSSVEVIIARFLGVACEIHGEMRMGISGIEEAVEAECCIVVLNDDRQGEFEVCFEEV